MQTTNEPLQLDTLNSVQLKTMDISTNFICIITFINPLRLSGNYMNHLL
jgi:hypothetical protein